MHGNLVNHKRLPGSILLIHLDLFHLCQRRKPFVANDLSKHGVQPIQMRRFIKRQEKLRTIRARALVGHGHDAALAVAQRRTDLVFKGASPDGAAALGVLGRAWVRGAAGLDHEAGNQAVEGGLVVVAGCAEGEKVLSGVGG